MKNIDFRELLEKATPWLLDHGVKIAVIAVVVIVAKKVLNFIIEKAVRALVRGNGSVSAEEKRENTLIGVFQATIGIVLWLIAGLMILSEIGVDIGPLIAAAGVIGLALGFGGQYLIKDLIAGLFILLENQYRVGDAITIDGTRGSVEKFTLRTTMVRDADGTLHFIQNGNIALASNRAHGFSRINLVVGVAYDTDLDKLKKVINAVGEKMAQDKDWKAIVLKAPEFLRVDDFGPSEVMIKITGEVKAGQQSAATGELRKRIKKAFDKEGIEIPFPQVVMHNPEKK